MSGTFSTIATKLLGLSCVDRVLRLRRPALLLVADLGGILGTAFVIGGIRAIFFPYELSAMVELLPFLAIAPLFFYIEGLYDHVLPPFPQELRRIGIGITVAYLVVGLALFLSRTEHLPSRMTILLVWLASMAVTPCLRVLIRKRFASRPWWGKDVVIFGSPDAIAHLTHFLRFSPENGLRPAAAVCQGNISGPSAFIVDTLPQLRNFTEVETYAAAHPGAYAIILGDTFSSSESRELMEQAGRIFPSVFLMVGYMGTDMPLWLRPVEVAHTMTLQMRQNLFDPRRLFLKRCTDIMCALVGGLILLPFLAAIAAWIKLETPGPIFFSHKRLGMHEKHFKMLKFRTMVKDADKVLEEYLNQDPALHREWEEDQKLRNDPRITKSGKFLRHYSLDELPQIVNVLWGDMSLVGPRPIVDDEIVKYGKAYEAYTRVRPGMTGLWQVSGRSDTSYAYRVSIDNYYICNWSIWMDIWILARTPLVVIKGAGAY